MWMPGGWEILLIFVAIIILFGASKLPEFARSMGRSMGEFKRGQIEIEKEVQAMKSVPVQASDVELTRVQRMAMNLNIDIKGKSDEQLLAEVEKKMDEKERAAKN